MRSRTKCWVLLVVLDHELRECVGAVVWGLVVKGASVSRETLPPPRCRQRCNFVRALMDVRVSGATSVVRSRMTIAARGR